jgi:hypothetical protein
VAETGGRSKDRGHPLRLDGQPYTVVGVQAPGDQDRGQNQLTVRLVFKPEQLNHDFHWLLVMGRMKPGVTLQQAQQNMSAGARLAIERSGSDHCVLPGYPRPHQRGSRGFPRRGDDRFP